MLKKEHIVIDGQHNKPIVIDFTYQQNSQNKPILIFCHGYKGFKDWGAWNLMMKTLVNEGFYCIKFNFSHNGGTVKQPIDFPDLDAFGNNNYSKELDDLKSVLDWCHNNETIKSEGDLGTITLMGHSRGGGIVAITAFEDKRVKKLISLASISDFLKRSVTNTDLENWKKTGVKYVVNGRTKQQMPHFYQFYLDTIKNRERLNIENAVSNLKIPHLIIHGDNDTSIFLEEAKNLHKWNPNSTLAIIEGADHVLNTRHPWEKEELPIQLKEAIKKIILFLKK